MGSVVTKGTMFPEKVVEGMFNKVKGKSSLARLADQMPVAFTGNKIFTFAMDKELGVVGEGVAKENGGVTVAPVTVAPIKLEYGARVTDEFLYASEEDKLNILENFAEGFATKLAKAIDIIGIHGTNPRNSSSVVATTYIDQAGTVSQSTGTAGEALESAVAALGDYDVTGIITNKAFASNLAKSTTGNIKDYPDFKAWGSEESYINGVPAEVNSTVGSTDYAIVGDFSAFKWGYAKDINVEVIEYGNPDNDADAGDLKGHNQVYLRAEVYLATAVLDTAAFKRVVA